MNVITIPKKIAGSDDLVILPRREYESLLYLKRTHEFEPTLTQKKALAHAEKNLKSGKTLSFDELASKLGFAN